MSTPSFPVLFAAVLLLVFDRSFGTSFFLSDIYNAGQALRNQSSSPVLFQHLFWFLGHPEACIIIMLAMGIVSEIMATTARKPIFSYRTIIDSLLGISLLTFVVLSHHIFVAGMDPFLGSVFIFLTLMIAVPSAVKTFGWPYSGRTISVSRRSCSSASGSCRCSFRVG